MPELGPYGSVRGARGNSRPYRESRRGPAEPTRMTHIGVRQESWQRIGGESPPWGKDQPSAPTPSDARRPARADVKRSQGRPRAKY